MVLTEPETSIPAGLTIETVRITHVRGPMTQQVRKAMLEQGGEEAWNKLLAQVSEPCRSVFMKPVGLFEWVDAELSSELSVAYQDRFGEAWAFDRGRGTAREQLTFINRWLLKALSPAFVLQNAARVFRFYYRGGQLVLDELDSHSARISLWANGYYPAWYEQGLPGWAQEALEMSGARNVASSYAPPSGEGLEACHHRYRLTWG